MTYEYLPKDAESRLTKAYENMFNEMYKRCEKGFLQILDTYIEFWSEPSVQEFYYDVSPVEVLNQVKNTVLTGEFDIRMVNNDEDG